MTKVGICQCCKEERELIKAHIVPRCFYLDYKEVGGYKSVDFSNGKWKQQQCGVYDNEILCSTCDNEILGKLDNEARKILFEEFKKYPEKSSNTGIIYHLKTGDFNYDLLRKFFISIIWRASISNLNDFKYVDLGKYEKIALQNIKGERFDDNLFKCLVFKSPENKQFNRVVYIEHARLFNANIYNIVMASYSITIFINCSGMPLSEKKFFEQLFITKDKLLIMESEKIYNDKVTYLFKMSKNLRK